MLFCSLCVFFLTVKLFYTMKLIYFEKSFILVFGFIIPSFFSFARIIERRKFPTLKLIFYAPKPKSLVLQAFLKKEKERKLQYQWYHNFRSYLVRERRLELPRRLTHAPQTCLSTCSSTLAWPEGMSYYSRYEENVKS